MIFPIQVPSVHDLGCNGKAFADYLGGGDLFERFKAARNKSR